MAKPPQADTERPARGLYLVTPLIEDAAGFSGALRDAVQAAEIAAVLLRLKDAGERELINRIKVLTAIVQDNGAALILDGHPDLAARAGADGAHLTGIEAFSAAVDNLKPARIAGCGGLKSRDDAMTAGERGADYVMFGEPKPDGYRPALETIVERVEWWAQLFTVPCVGFAGKPDEIGPLIAAGADFVALGDSVWSDPRGPAAAVAEASQLLAVPEAAR